LPHDLPHDLERIEVMITASMAADAATSATAEVLLAHFEQTMTMGEALAAGLHVAEWGMADALIRSLRADTGGSTHPTARVHRR